MVQRLRQIGVACERVSTDKAAFGRLVVACPEVLQPALVRLLACIAEDRAAGTRGIGWITERVEALAQAELPAGLRKLARRAQSVAQEVVGRRAVALGQIA